MLFIMKAYEIQFLLRKANHKMPIIEPKLLCHGFVKTETNKFVERDSLCIMQIQQLCHSLSFKFAEQNMSPKMILII